MIIGVALLVGFTLAWWLSTRIQRTLAVIGEIAASAQELARTAEQLQALVDRFQVA